MTQQLSQAMQLALNSALSERAAIRARQGLMTGSYDDKRPNAYCSFGFPENLCFADYYKLFTRGGVAHGAVMRLVEKCWQTDPSVRQGSEEKPLKTMSAWDKEFQSMAKRLKLWEKFREADMRRLVGNYSCIILQIADNKSWDQPVGRVSANLVKKLVVAWQGQMRVTEWNDEQQSENFGMPKMWQYQEVAVPDGAQEVAQNGRSLNIHPDRVIVVGDIRDGIPFLQAGYNAAVSMLKIIGGSGESYLKNASRALSINFDKEVQLDSIARAHGVNMDELQGIFDEVTKSLNTGIDQTIVTQGASVTPLVANVPDPASPFDVSLQEFSASVQIPSKIIAGNQTGERASTQDLADFNQRGQGRRLNTLTSDIEYLVNHFMVHGILSPTEYSVVWDDLNEATQSEKLDNAEKLAKVNQVLLGTGQEAFTIDEIREAAGFEPNGGIDILPDEDPEPLPGDEDV